MDNSQKYNSISARRFPKYQLDGKWEEDTVENLFTFIPNNTLSRIELNYEKGDVLNIHYGDILIKFEDCLDVKKEVLPYITDDGIARKLSNTTLKAGDVVIADTAEDESAGKCIEIINLTNESIVAGLHTIAIRPKREFASRYLGFYMNSNLYRSQLFRLMQGVKVTSISKSALKKTTIRFPSSIEEQSRIAEVLFLLDGIITECNSKLEILKSYKEGLMQKLFPAKGQKVPELRFKEFDKEGEWEEKKLGELFDRVTKRNAENNQNVLTISAQYGLVSQYNYFNKNVAALDVTNYYLINKGDFAYNKSRSQGYPYGAIKSLRLYDKGVVSTLYICFRIKKEVNSSTNFFEHYFETDLINDEIGRIAQEGARNHGLLNISTDDFFNKVSIIVPSPSEQKKIADCLSSIDNMISYYTEKLSLLEQHKKGLMQLLFPNYNR